MIEPRARLDGDTEATLPTCPTCHGSGIVEVVLDPDACERCGGEGYWQQRVRFGEPGFGRSVKCPACGGFGSVRAYVHELQQLAEIPSAFRDADFAGFDLARNPTMTEALGTVRTWAERGDAPPFLLLAGPVGTGKTHLACAALKAVLGRRQAGRFYSMARLLEDLRESQRPGYEGPSLRQLRGEIEAQALVVLDDFGVDRPTEFASEQLFLIVDHRWQERKRTIFTTNIDPSRIEERVRSRVMDWQVSEIVTCRGKDQRRMRGQ